MIVKWGIIGLGKIAEKFAEDLSLVQGNRLVAVASRSLERANAFAERHNNPKAYGSYLDLIKDPEVDIIYIATPHHRHAELSRTVMGHGKHVLCEKPAAMSVEEFESVKRAWQESGCFYMEALWSRFNPSIRKAYELIGDGVIGRIRYISADFCFRTAERLDSRLFDKGLGGGALLDIGIYPLFLSYLILGIPEALEASSKFADTGVDLQTAVILKYPESHAILYASFDVISHMDARIYGEEGYICFRDRWHETKGFEVIRGNEVMQHSYDYEGHGYTFEIEACQKAIKGSETFSPLWTPDDSMSLISMMDRVRSKTGLAYDRIT